jgi:hypothetical protein
MGEKVMTAKQLGWAIELADGSLVKGFGNSATPVGTGTLKRVTIFRDKNEADVLVAILRSNNIEAETVSVERDGGGYRRCSS